jgi:tetratricopeptide (TPR) repeat protein
LKKLLTTLAGLFLLFALNGQNLGKILQDSLTYKSDLWKKDRLSYYLNSEEINPDDYNSLFNRGLENLRNELYQEALTDFKATLDATIVSNDMVPSLNKYKHKSESYFYIGVSFELLDKQDSAKYYLTKAIEINPYYDDAYIEYASIELRNGRAGEAVNVLTKAYENNPKSKKLLINLAAMYMENGKMGKAKKLLKSAEDLMPDFPDPLISLAMIYAYEQKYNTANNYLDKALAIDSTVPYALYVKGVYNFLQNNYEEAFVYLSRFHQIDSTESTTTFYLGVLQLKFGNVKEGYKNLHHSIQNRINQTYSFETEDFIFHLLADIYKKLELISDTDEAQLLAGYFSQVFTNSTLTDETWYEYERNYLDTDLHKLLKLLDQYYFCYSTLDGFCNKTDLLEITDKALEVNDSLLSVKLIRGSILYALKNYYTSANEFEEIIEIDPTYRLAWYEKAKVYKKLEKYDTALIILDSVLFRYPQFIDAENLRGELYAECVNDQQKAIEAYLKVWELQPFNPEHTENIGKCYSKMNMKDSAIFYYNISIELNQNPYNTIFLRGKEYYDLAIFDTAMMDFNVCVDNGGQNYLKSLVYRGFCYNKLGEYDKAIKDLNSVLSYEKSNGTLYYNIGYIYLSQGNYKKAHKFFDDGMELDPEYKWNYYGKALCLNAESDYKASIMYSLQATTKDSTFADAYLVAADNFYEIGKYTQSYHFNKKAAELNYFDYTASFNTGLCMLRLGMMDNALKIYNAYSEIPDVQKHPDYQEAIEKLKALVESDIQKEDAMRILSEVFSIDLYTTDIAHE